MQCLRVGSTKNRGPPGTNFVGESNPTSPKLTHTLHKHEHAHSQTTETHTTDTETPAQYTSEGDPAQEVTQPETTETAQIRAMHHKKPPCSTSIKETQHRRAQDKTNGTQNTMPRLGPCSARETGYRARERRPSEMAATTPRAPH